MIKAHVGLFRVGRCRAFSLLLKEVETDADAVGIRTLSIRHIRLDLMDQPCREQDQAALDWLKIDFGPSIGAAWIVGIEPRLYDLRLWPGIAEKNAAAFCRCLHVVHAAP